MRGEVIGLADQRDAAMDQNVSRPEREEQQADVAVHGEESGVHAGQIVRLYKAMFIDEQCNHDGNAQEAQDAQVKRKNQHHKTCDHGDVQETGDCQALR